MTTVELPAEALPRISEPRSGWRRAALVAGGVAAVELIALVVIALAFIAKPFAHSDTQAKARSTQATSKAHATTTVAHGERESKPKTPVSAAVHAVPPQLARAKTGVLVLNGNGQYGAASEKATVVRSLRYPVVGTADASRRDYARTIVMFRPGFKGEAQRLARDLGLALARAVPLDGMRPAELGAAKLVLIVGRTA